MIVQCEQCQTRFKIPDERVTEKGVKVRCTKCGNTFRVTKAGGTAPAAAPDDPFARFASAESADPTKRTLELKAMPAGTLPPSPVAPSAPPASSAFDFSSLVPGPPPPAAPPPGGAAPLFDFSALVPPSGAGAPTAAPVPPPAAGTGALAFDFSGLTAPPPPPGPAPKPVRQEAKAAESTPSFDFSSLGSGPPPPPPPSVPTPNTAPAHAASPQANADALNGALPELNLGSAPKPASQAMLNSLFGDDEAGPPRPSPTTTQAVRDELFDMPAPSPEPDSGPTTIERIELGTDKDAAGVPLARLSPPRQNVALPVPVASSRRTALGIFVNVVIALVLLAAIVLVGNALANDGRLDAKALSPERLVELLSPPKALIPLDISNGLYQTKAGRPLFYVRGQIDNRTDGASRAKVVVSLMNGEQVVRSGETVAGVAPSPEELFGLSRVDELEALQAKLRAKAVDVPPGGQAPFVMAFFEYPPDLSEFRVKVAVEPLGATATP